MIRNASAALAVLAVVASAAAQVPAQPSINPGPAAAADRATATEARRVVRDKDTGKLRAPTADELKEMLEQERADRAARGQPEPGTTPVVVRQHPNGMKSAVLGSDHLVSLQAERGADGKLSIKHGGSAHEHASHPTTAAKE